MVENPLPPGRLVPVEPKVEALFKTLAPDPVRFFLTNEKENKRPLELHKILTILAEFRMRLIGPDRGGNYLKIQKSTADPNLVLFVESPNYTLSHYLGLFTIVRRLGFDVSDARMLLMHDVNLGFNSEHLGELVQTLEAAKITVEALKGLPPVTRKGSPITVSKQ